MKTLSHLQELCNVLYTPKKLDMWRNDTRNPYSPCVCSCIISGTPNNRNFPNLASKDKHFAFRIAAGGNGLLVIIARFDR